MLKFIFFAISSYLLFVFILYMLQEKMLFFPDQHDFANCPNSNLFKVDIVNSNFEGENIRYYIQKKEQAKAYLIHFHGNAGAACDRFFLFEYLQDSPVNIILAEYPGYSNDSKSPNQKNILRNAEKLFDKITKENSDHLPIFIFGESLGTGVATYLAGRRNVSGIILQSSYTSITDIGRVHYPYLPIKWIIRNSFKSYEWAEKVKCEVLALHGKEDNIIPITLGRKLMEYFPTNPEFIEFNYLGHNDLVFNNSKMWETVNKFIKKVISKQ